jgi:hypothetical protein
MTVENPDYAAFARRILAAFGRRIADGDIEALTDLTNLAAALDDAIAHAITGLRGYGYSWADIADRLGITRQAAHQRWANPPNGTEPPMTTWNSGDIAYLVPHLPTAPREAYRQPRCAIITLPAPGTPDHGRAEIELPDGTRLWTSLRNLQPHPPTPGASTPKPPVPTRRILLADNEEQPALFDPGALR